MARKQITIVRLVRRPRRDAQRRLWLAYTYLIAENRLSANIAMDR